ncbi:hypothetical protein AK812_SmicGene12191 [Symbiodinium microadriaticum]|uniref:Uncharacterized protein n=1 Tax=Symbiodinium microadriaticum TaxID=2951 RepID=A0A1Q9EBC2_SYMMI|nr:hypothetical protein AK812_SmicGene12191 [Symbiodinium microadriaticum]
MYKCGRMRLHKGCKKKPLMLMRRRVTVLELQEQNDELQVYRPGASHDSLRSPGKFLTLDTKLLEALTTVSRGELAGEILIFKETEAAKDRAVRGRQVLYLFDQYFKTNEEVGSLYSVEDLLKVRLINDDLSTFLSNWESVMSGLSHMPDETTVRDIFLRELRQSKRLKYDLEIYDRAKEGSEQHSYAFLKNSIREMLTRERKRKNRDRIARSHGDKYGAAASPRSTSPLTEVAVKGRKAREVRDPEARAEEGRTCCAKSGIPKGQLSSRKVQMIAVEFEGKRRKHAPNPQDLTKAIVWAKQFERVAECMVRNIPAACQYECEEEGLMCESCEKTVRPSCAGLVPGLEFLADTGSEEDLISKNDKQAHFPDIPIGAAARPVSLITANGPVQGNTSVKLDVPELGSTLECYVLDPPLRYVHAGKSPYFVTPEGKKLYCTLRGRVPVIGEKAIASPATGDKAINGPVLRASEVLDPGIKSALDKADSEAEAESEPRDEKHSAQLKLEVCQKAKMLAPHARLVRNKKGSQRPPDTSSEAEIDRTPEAKTAMDKEWQKLVDKSCWLHSKAILTGSGKAAKVIDVFGSQPGYSKQQADARRNLGEALRGPITNGRYFRCNHFEKTGVKLPRKRLYVPTTRDIEKFPDLSNVRITDVDEGPIVEHDTRRLQPIPSKVLMKVEIDPANHKVRPKTPCPVKIDGVIARVDPELDGDSEKMRHTDRPDIEGAAEQLLSAKVNQQIAVEGASHNTKAAYPLRTKADLVLWNHDHDLESNLLTSEACPCAAGRKTTPDIMTTTQTGVDRPTAPLTVYHQGDTARLEWLHSLLWCDIFGDELSQTTSEDFTTTLSAVYADKPPQVAAQVTFAGSANADQFPTIKKLAEVSDEGLSRIQPGDSRGREKGLVIVSDSTTVFMAGKRTFCDLAPDIKEMRTGNGILSHYAHVEYCPIWGASLPPIVDKVHELVGKIIQESSRPQSLAVDVMIIWMGNELFGRRGVFVASLSSPSEENVKFLQEAYPFDRYGERVYRMKHVFDRALFNAQYSRRLLRQAEIQQATEDCPDPWETEWAASSSAGPSTTATFDEVMAAIPYRTPDNQTIAGLRRLRAEGEAIQAKAKAAREAAAPHSGGRMLPPAEDLIGYTWDEDAILNDMLGVDDAMFGSHDAEGMVILTKADIPTAHLDKLVPSPCQFLHSDQDIDQTRLNGLVRSPGQFVRCWSSRPVSASVQNRPRLVRSLGQLVRSDRGNRPGPVDRVTRYSSSGPIGPVARSGRDGPVTRLTGSGRLVSSSGPIGPVARSGRVGPFARQFVRSPVPVSFSFRPDPVTGLNGEPG